MISQKKLSSEEAADVREAVAVLKAGGVILYPTDTIWGIGCDATNSEAVKRIFEIKERSDSKALITLVDSIASLERVVDNIPDVAYELIDVAVSPLTIVYDKAYDRAVAPELLAKDGSIGVRITREKISAAICRGLQGPLVSTSANISGRPSPRVYSEIPPEIMAQVDYVCSSRRNEIQGDCLKPSGIIRLSRGGIFKIIR